MEFYFFEHFFYSDEQRKDDFLLNFPQKLNLSGKEFIFETQKVVCLSEIKIYANVLLLES
jgi:hypothetical protein